MGFEEILEGMESMEAANREGLELQELPPKLDREGAGSEEEAPPKLERETMKLGETVDQRCARHRLENAIANGNSIQIKNRTADYAKTLVKS